MKKYCSEKSKSLLKRTIGCINVETIIIRGGHSNLWVEGLPRFRKPRALKFRPLLPYALKSPLEVPVH